MKKTDVTAAYQASGVGGWGYYSGSGSGEIAGGDGDNRYECHKKTGDGTGTPMRPPLLPAAHTHL